MKTYGKVKRVLVATGLISCFAFTAKAEIPENVKLIMLDNQKVALYIQNPQQQSISIELVNSLNGDVVYKTNGMTDAYYARLYNLTGLSEGGYTLKCQSADKIYEKEILLQDDKPVLLTETSYTTPVFKRDEDNLLITVFNPSKEDVSVTFQKGAEVFYTDNPSAEGSFKRNYNLDKLAPGEYSISVLKGVDRYIYALEVK